MPARRKAEEKLQVQFGLVLSDKSKQIVADKILFSYSTVEEKR